MGLSGLLALLRWFRTRVSLRHLALLKPGGVTLGVDGHVWLHEFASKHARAFFLEGNRDVIGMEVLERCRQFICGG